MKGRVNQFTLIELIVDVTMILILATILMSTMEIARREAKNIECRGKLKMLGEGIGLFTSDNKNDMPESNTGNAATYMHYYVWDFAPYFGYEEHVYNIPAGRHGTQDFLWYKWYYEVPDIFQCPFREDKGYVSYGWNYWYIHGWGKHDQYPNHGKRWHRIKYGYAFDGNTTTANESHPVDVASQVVMGDSANINRGSENIGRHGARFFDRFSNRHVGGNNELGGNYLFLDGHVQWKAQSFLASQESFREFWSTKP